MVPAVVASSPGKVLITGGYLVLERPNAGIVISTNARFYAVVKPLREEINPKSWAWAWTDVKVTSPQLSREVEYKFSLKHLTLQNISSRDSSNPFVEQAVQYAVAAAKVTCTDTDRAESIHKLLLQGLHITILGSNDFYSYRNQIKAHGLPLAPETLSTLAPFSSITLNLQGSNGASLRDNCKPEVAKTGLGSSAAMTASVVAALLHYFGAVNLQLSDVSRPVSEVADSDLDTIHAIAQSAHCIAQGKIGSGFDVSAAVYGSQRYIRFSPSILSAAQVGFNKLLDVVSDILKEKWDHEKTQFSLPPLMKLVLGEPGSGGSSTPSMVGAVKTWQKTDHHKAFETFNRLAGANSMLEIQLKKLSIYAKEDWEAYKYVMMNCSTHKHEKWPGLVADQFQDDVVKSLKGARDTFTEIRFYMRQMGEAAGVPIEPESQTQLLDVTIDIEGVLLAGVPGAGGFDAIFAITLGEADSTVAKTWSSIGVLPLLVNEDPRGVTLESGDPRLHGVSSAISSIQIS